MVTLRALDNWNATCVLRSGQQYYCHGKRGKNTIDNTLIADKCKKIRARVLFVFFRKIYFLLKKKKIFIKIYFKLEKQIPYRRNYFNNERIFFNVFTFFRSKWFTRRKNIQLVLIMTRVECPFLTKNKILIFTHHY